MGLRARLQTLTHRHRPRFMRHPVRNVDFGDLQETFLVAAIATILVIRTQLWATNYPQLGGNGLHIAHLLWGGVFMTIALWLLFTYLGRSVRVPGAVLGGVGFGFFIDELGKFITSDNNYFYKPAAALIYVIFLGLWLLSRALQRRRGFSEREYLANAIEIVADAARHDLDERERRRALEMLDKADPAGTDETVSAVRRLLHEVETVPTPPPPRLTRWALRLRDFYLRRVESPRFRKFVGVVFVLWAIGGLLATFQLVLSIGVSLGGARAGFEGDGVEDLGFINIASLVSSAASGVLAWIGVWRLRFRTRLEAYAMFDRALIVSIFVTQVFAFVESQFGACFALGINVILLATLRYMMGIERQLQRAGHGELPPAPAPGPPAPPATPATPAEAAAS